MGNENRNQRLGIKALEDRVEKLKAELAGVADEIAELEKDREADMTEQERQLGLAKLAHCNAIEEQKECFLVASATENKGRALISSGEKLLAEAREQRAAAEQMDLQVEPIRQAEFKIRERREHWRDELARIQNSAIRRKRTQLEQTIAKLERRMTRKASEPEIATGPVPIVPRNTGTGRVEGIGKVIAEQPMAVLAGLLAGIPKRPPIAAAPTVDEVQPEAEAQPEAQPEPAPAEEPKAQPEEPTT